MEDQSNITGDPSNDEAYASYLERQILTVVAVVISVLGTIGNVLVIAAVVLSKRLRHATDMFVLNLSIADLLTCTYVIPMGTVAGLSVDHWPLPMGLCVLAAFIFVLCLGCSINNLACIAISRYVMVTRNKATYKKFFSRRRTLAAIVLTWLVPMCVALIPHLVGYIQLGYDQKYSSCTWVTTESSSGIGIILFSTSIPVQFSLIFGSYLGIFLHIRTHSNKVQHLHNPSSISGETEAPNQQANQRVKHDDKLQTQVTKNLFCVMCTFMVCVIPYNAALVFTNKEKFLPIAVIIFLANSCMNPIVYATKHPHFKAVFRCITFGKFKEIPDRISFRFFK